MRLLILLLFSPMALFSQFDTTRFYRSPNVGDIFRRAKINALMLPSDTTTNKVGIAQIGSVLYTYSSGRWNSIGSTDTISLSNRIDTKLNISDTSTMLMPYRHWNAGYTPQTRTISTTAPLQGGGDLSADRTLSIDTANTSYISRARADSNYWRNGGNSFGTTSSIGTNNIQDLIFKTNNVEAMRINSLRQVSIGTSVSNGRSLMVQGSIQSSSVDAAASANIVTTAVSGFPYFRMGRSGQAEWFIGSPDNSPDLGISSGSFNNYAIYFKNNFNGTSNIGIGTTNPLYNADINGTARIVTTPTITNATSVLVKDPSTNQISEQSISNIISTTWRVNGNTITSGQYLGTNNAEDLVFRVNNIERARAYTALQGWNFGLSGSALGQYAFNSGYLGTASAIVSTNMGSQGIASGSSSFNTGNLGIASGNFSFNSGLNASASGASSFNSAERGTASGNFSFNSAHSGFARSYGEHNLGVFSTDYTPASTTAWSATDRLFNIGNGITTSRSNAFTILKNGSTFILGKVSQPTNPNSPKGTATLVNGVVTISNTLATTGCFISVNYRTGVTPTTTTSTLVVTTVTNNTSFVVTAYQAGTVTINTSDNNQIEYTISN